MQNLKGLTVAMMGGDAREIILARELARKGAIIKVLGLPVDGTNIIPCAKPRQCLAGVQALILPIPGVNEHMELYGSHMASPLEITGELLAPLPAGAPVLTGLARQPLRDLISQNNLVLVELMQLDEVAILNSIPSAEGAVQMAMERLPITIHGSKAMVLGFGRTGQTLAQLLLSMHADTTVVARNPSQLARATAMGLQALSFDQLTDHLNDVNMIFNTVPGPVIDEDLLLRLPLTTLIIDLASAPGGTDFMKAREVGIEAVLAPGLPGKVAPKTAGLILARVVPGILLHQLKH